MHKKEIEIKNKENRFEGPAGESREGYVRCLGERWTNNMIISVLTLFPSFQKKGGRGRVTCMCPVPFKDYAGPLHTPVPSFFS